MASLVSWVRRNRRKLAVSGAVIGGLYVVGKIAETQYSKYREEENRKLIQKVRKENHFAATDTTCIETLAALFPLLRKELTESLDTESLTSELRSNKDLSKEDKLRLWNELKSVSVTRCVVLVVGGVYLAVMVRIQLNILAGYLFNNEPMANNNIKMGSVSREVQEKFLSICNNFVSLGLKSLCFNVHEMVKGCVEKLELQQKLSLAEIEAVFQEVLRSLKSASEDANLFTNCGVYFLPASNDFIEDLVDADKEELKKMFAETLDVIECEDSVELVNKLCRYNRV